MTPTYQKTQNALETHLYQYHCHPLSKTQLSTLLYSLISEKSHRFNTIKDQETALGIAYAHMWLRLSQSHPKIVFNQQVKTWMITLLNNTQIHKKTIQRILSTTLIEDLSLNKTLCYTILKSNDKACYRYLIETLLTYQKSKNSYIQQKVSQFLNETDHQRLIQSTLPSLNFNQTFNTLIQDQIKP